MHFCFISLFIFTSMCLYICVSSSSKPLWNCNHILNNPQKQSQKHRYRYHSLIIFVKFYVCIVWKPFVILFVVFNVDDWHFWKDFETYRKGEKKMKILLCFFFLVSFCFLISIDYTKIDILIKTTNCTILAIFTS